MSTPVAVIPVAVLVLASGVAAQGLPAPQRRDSAGIAIIEYATIQTSAPAFRVAPQLLADVGGIRDEPREEIESSGYESAVRLSDGRIAVAERYAVRVLDPAGRFVRVIGRRGSGPGEFGSVAGLCLIQGDTLIVRDGARRISVFDSAGRHVSSSIAEANSFVMCSRDGTTLGASPPAGGFTGGSGRSGARLPDEMALQQQYTTVWRLNRAGSLMDSIGVFATTRGPPGSTIVSDVFAAALFGDRVYFDNAVAPEVKIYSMSGRLVSIIRWRDPVVQVTPQIAEALAAGRIPANAPGRADRIKMMLQRPYPPTLPVYSGFFVDRVGRLWVRDPWPVTGSVWTNGWTVFAADGTLLGRYAPPKFGGELVMVTDAGPDYVVLRVRSADQGVRVVVQGIAGR